MTKSVTCPNQCIYTYLDAKLVYICVIIVHQRTVGSRASVYQSQSHLLFTHPPPVPRSRYPNPSCYTVFTKIFSNGYIYMYMIVWCMRRVYIPRSRQGMVGESKCDWDRLINTRTGTNSTLVNDNNKYVH